MKTYGNIITYRGLQENEKDGTFFKNPAQLSTWKDQLVSYYYVSV